MLSLILVILVVLSIVLHNRGYDYEFLGGLCAFFSVLAACIIIACSLLLLSSLTINEEIALCKQNNAEIEQSVEGCVDRYMQYEKGTFEDLKPDTDYIAFAQIYPELKTNEMIQEQIKLYQKNKQKIYDLEVKKMKLKIYKFLLYCGR